MKLLKLDQHRHSDERHDQAEGLVVARGEITVSMGGQSFAVKTGGMFVVPAGAVHSFESGDGGTVVIFD
jgi:mannose-6-phosphate isomerase-like protein (cupin superfamily)